MSAGPVRAAHGAAWTLLALSVAVCLFWIGWSMRDQAREKAALTLPTRERAAWATEGAGEVLLGAVGHWAADRDELDGMELAASLVNDRGGLLGRTLRVVPAEDGGQLHGARRAALELAADPRVLAVVGHGDSGLAQGLDSLYEASDLLLLATSGAVWEIPDPEGTVFHLGQSLRSLAEACARFVESSGAVRPVLVAEASVPGRRFSVLLESALDARGRGLRVLETRGEAGPEPVRPEVSDPAADFQGDVVVLHGSVRGMAGLAAASRTRWPAARMALAGEAAPQDGEALSAAIQLAGVAGSGRGDFVQAFRARYGREPGPLAALGFDAVSLLDQAARLAGTLELSAWAGALRGLDRPSSVTGVEGFDASGQARRPDPAF